MVRGTAATVIGNPTDVKYASVNMSNGSPA